MSFNSKCINVQSSAKNDHFSIAKVEKLSKVYWKKKDLA